MKTKKGFKPKHGIELRKSMKEYALGAGFHVNPNKEELDILVKGLLKNKETHGEFYCPCRVLTGDKEKDKEIICPCVFHKKEIKSDRHCKCFLFFSKKK